jgi:hypothetical protein
MVLTQINKINASNAVWHSVPAQFERSYSCALFKNSKGLINLEMLKTQTS